MKCFALLLVFLLGPSWNGSAAKPSASRITGQLVDEFGAVISNARIVIHWDPDAPSDRQKSNVGVDHDLTIPTDANGRYSVQIPSGLYDVFVSSPGFYPSCKKLWVGKGKEATYSPSLKAYTINSVVLD
jgi:Carboxypeptidase regulatory-like domain